MKLSDRVKPISYLKSHAAEIFAELREQREPLIVTQNGEAKAVLQDIASFEEMQQTLALLKLLAIRGQEFERGDGQDLEEAFAELTEIEPNEHIGER